MQPNYAKHTGAQAEPQTAASKCSESYNAIRCTNLGTCDEYQVIYERAAVNI